MNNRQLAKLGTVLHLAVEYGLEVGDWSADPRIAEEVDCASPNTQFAFRKLWKKCVVELHQRNLSRVFMTIGVADTFWHPQFFSTVTFESQRSTEEERSWSLLQPL